MKKKEKVKSEIRKKRKKDENIYLLSKTRTYILNSLLFHTDPEVEFHFAGMSVTVCDGAEPLLRVSAMVYGEGVFLTVCEADPNFYSYILQYYF